MIEAGLEFDDPVDRVTAALLALPAPLRPMYFSHEETPRSASDTVDDARRFAAFVAKSPSGYFLLGDGVTYSLRIAPGLPVLCDAFLQVQAPQAEQFLIRMAAARPVFGFACDPAERETRNRVAVQQGDNVVEAWVGRDTGKHVPGLYWLTLLPQSLAQRHDIALPKLAAAALEHRALPDGQQLFRFYAQPQDWRDAPVVDALRVSLPGVFDIEKARPAILAAENFLELTSVLQDWR